MPTQLLPSNPNLDQLKHQAKDLIAACRKGEQTALSEVSVALRMPAMVPSVAQALQVIAVRYSFSSWPKLKLFVETSSTHDISPTAVALRKAIDDDQLSAVRSLLDATPDLIEEFVRRSSRIYQNQRPLVYAAQKNRIDIVRLLLSRGADPTADGYLALARSALHDSQVAMMSLLLDQGIDPNVDVYDWGPLILTPCETLAPDMLRMLLQRGADPNRSSARGRCHQSPMEMLLGTYGRNAEKVSQCVELLITAGADFEDSAIMDIHRGRVASLAERIDADPQLLHRHQQGIDYGVTGARALTASGGTLLHVAAEFCQVAVAKYLISIGAKVNAAAQLDPLGRGGQTPLFHAVAHYHDWGVAMTELLLSHGADPNVKCTLRGHMDKADDYPTSSVMDYALKFPPGRTEQDPTLMLLRRYGAKP